MTTKHSSISKWQQNLLPNIVDHLASSVPDSVYVEFPRSEHTYADGFRQVTYREFANAINGIAHWLRGTLGLSDNFEALAYIGPNDVRYTAIVLGAVKAGYTMLMISPRNSIAAQLALCASTKCNKLLSPNPAPPAVTNLLQESKLEHFTVPSLEELLGVEHPNFPYMKSYQQAKDDPLFIIHTSGSTGIPKPLIWRHESAVRNIEMHASNPPDGFTSQNQLFHGTRVVNMMPPFHGAGLVSHLFQGVAFGTVYISPLPTTVPSASAVVEMLHHTTAEAAIVPPSLVLEFAQSADLLEYAGNHLQLLMYCGGDLPQAVGDAVSSKLLLRCQYGASEIGITPQILPQSYDKNDWKYVGFPTCLGFEFQPVADGLSELVVVRNPALEATQPSFVLFPDQNEYRSRDLFRPHPNDTSQWAWTARADDIIVFLNGEKTNPISFEQHVVAQHKEVSAAIITGSQRFQAALLVECRDELPTTADEANFINQIWSSVEEANKLTPAHARIEKSMILPLDKNRPMLRAGKGTIQRAATLQVYADKIEQLYRNADIIPGDISDPTIRAELFASVDSMANYIRSLLSTSLPSDSKDFFSTGMDSLAALGLTRKLRNQLGMPKISISMIYANPSADRLAEAILSLQKSDVQVEVDTRERRKDQIQNVLAEFKARIEKLPIPQSKAERLEKKAVILTGTTGAIGKFVLKSLLEDPAIAHVHCFNRRGDARGVYERHLRSSGVDDLINDSRVTFHVVKFDKPGLGLDPDVYKVILTTASVIIHNAWPVNFNLPLESFRPQLEGVVNLVDLAARATQPTLFLFISSIGTILGRRTSAGRVEEKVYTEVSSMTENGYAESKWISEMLCEHAAKKLNVPTAFARVGQVAGPVNTPGIWNPSEWLPSLIKSSIELQVLPDSLGLSMDEVHWLPVDLLAECVVDLVLGRSNSANQVPKTAQSRATVKVFHLQNPGRTAWSALLPEVKAAIQATTGRSVEAVSCHRWLAAIRKTLEDAIGDTSGRVKTQSSSIEILVERIPAVKLLDFYSSSMSEQHGTDELDLTNALSNSATLRRVEAVNDAWMSKWIAEWTALT